MGSRIIERGVLRHLTALLLLLMVVSAPAWAAERGALFKISGDGHSLYLVGTMLSVGEFTRLGYSQADAVDVRLASLARERKVKVIELESVDSQMALLNSLSLEQQWAFVDETLKQMASGEAAREAREIANAWATADRKGLEAIAARVAADDSVGGRFTREVLLDGRNGALADGIAALLAKSDHSVAAIGVLHLIGKGSVPERLAKKGLTVERIY